MWIARGNKLDFRTINRFRLDMKAIIEDVFYEVIKLLIEKKYIKLQNYFLDGTKIEANANKYTFYVTYTVKGHPVTTTVKYIVGSDITANFSDYNDKCDYR